MSEAEKLSKADKTRRFIIKKAAELFNQQGYAGTSMKDIMEATGLTKGGLYGNFQSKEDIAIASFKYAVNAVQHGVGKRTKVIESPLDKLKAVVYFYKETLFKPEVEGGCPIMNTAVESDDNNPVLRVHAIKALDYWQGRIITTLQKGIERNEVKSDIDKEEFASLFISILEGGIMMGRLYKDSKHFDRVADQLIRMIENVRV